MINLLAAFLSEAAQDAPETPAVADIVVEYVVYAVIIVVSIFLLIFLRKRTRLPRHGELKKKLEGLHSDINAMISSQVEKRMNFIKLATRALYKADNLRYTATVMAEKERYADLGRIATLLGEARTEIAPYKYGKKEASEGDGMALAAEKVSEAIEVICGVIERDGDLQRRK